MHARHVMCHSCLPTAASSGSSGYRMPIICPAYNVHPPHLRVTVPANPKSPKFHLLFLSSEAAAQHGPMALTDSNVAIRDEP